MKKVLGYKLARPDGWDFYTGRTINYREGIGKIVKCPNGDSKLGLCSPGVIHASKNPNDCFVGAKIPCSAYRISGIPVMGDNAKWGFTELKIIKEILDLDTLFGWKYSEAINLVHPLVDKPKKPSQKDIDNLKTWASVWDSFRTSVWTSVRTSVRTSAGASVWDSIWDSVRYSVWYSGWDSVGVSIWDSVRDSARASVGDSVWAYIGSLFPNIKKWKYIEHEEGIYPFQVAVDLWKCGFVASFDGKIWRLHSGAKAEIVWEGKIPDYAR